MAKHRTHSIEFKRQVVQEFLGGESLHTLARRHGIGRRFRINDRKRHTEEQIFAILKEHEAGMKTADRARPPTPLSVP